MLDITVAADVGSSETRLATRREIRSEPTRAALDPANASRVLAVGRKAEEILNSNSVFPVRGGVSDVSLTALMLRRFTLDMLKRRSLFGVGLRLAVPASAKRIDIDALLAAGREAGFSRVSAEDGMLAGADGAGVDISGPEARMIADIGRERIGVLIAASGGVLLERTSLFGSSVFDRHLQAHFAMERNLLIGCAAAERIKTELDRPQVRVRGRDSLTGRPLSFAVPSSELREALAPTVRLVAGELAAAINEAPPEAAADILDEGIVLIGGGAMQYGLAKELEKQLGVPTVSAPNARRAAILGMQQSLRKSASRRGHKKTRTAFETVRADGE